MRSRVYDPPYPPLVSGVSWRPREPATAAYRESEALAAAAGAGDHAHSELDRTITTIAYLLTNTGRARDAEAEYRKTLTILEGWPTPIRMPCLGNSDADRVQ